MCSQSISHISKEVEDELNLYEKNIMRNYKLINKLNQIIESKYGCIDNAKKKQVIDTVMVDIGRWERQSKSITNFVIFFVLLIALVTVILVELYYIIGSTSTNYSYTILLSSTAMAIAIIRGGLMISTIKRGLSFIQSDVRFI